MIWFEWIAGIYAVSIGIMLILIRLSRNMRPSGPDNPQHPDHAAYMANNPAAVLKAKEMQRTLVLVRIAFVVGCIAIMAVIVRDINERRERHYEGVLDGPTVVADYYNAGYAWAAAHGIQFAIQCPGDNLAYGDGCRAYVAKRPH